MYNIMENTEELKKSEKIYVSTEDLVTKSA